MVDVRVTATAPPHLANPATLARNQHRCSLWTVLLRGNFRKPELAVTSGRPLLVLEYLSGAAMGHRSLW